MKSIPRRDLSPTRPLARGVVVCLAVMALACGGGTPVAKVLPGGEPDIIEAGSTSNPGDKSSSKSSTPTRRITVPRDAADKNGLYLAIRIEGMDPRAGMFAVSAGESFLVNPIVRNTTTNSVPVAYASEKRFDVIVYKDEDQREPVFVWSEHREFAATFQELMLAGGTTMSRMLEIPTTKDRSVDELMEGDLGRPLTPGTYHLWATHEGRPFLAAGPLKIQVVD